MRFLRFYLLKLLTMIMPSLKIKANHVTAELFYLSSLNMYDIYCRQLSGLRALCFSKTRELFYETSSLVSKNSSHFTMLLS